MESVDDTVLDKLYNYHIDLISLNLSKIFSRNFQVSPCSKSATQLRID